MINLNDLKATIDRALEQGYWHESKDELQTMVQLAIAEQLERIANSLEKAGE